MDEPVRQHLPGDWPRRVYQPEAMAELLRQAPIYAQAQHLGPWPLSIEMHDGFEVGILLVGQQRRLELDCETTLYPGDVWLTPMWEPHGWSTPEEGECSAVVRFRSEALGEEMLGDLPWLNIFAVPPSQRPRVTNDRMRARVLSLGEDLFAEAQGAGRKWRTAVRLDLLRLLFTISRDWDSPAKAASSNAFHESDLIRLRPALDMLREEAGEHVTVAAAAASCGLSVPRFCSVFKATMGVTFGQFSVRARTGSAANLLAATDLVMKEVAERSGFTDASHLHRAFVRLYGCTPGEYRRRFRE